MAETFVGRILFQTQKAVLFMDYYWHEPDWMPKSQAQITRDLDSDEVTLVATPWICRQKNIEEFKERLPVTDPDDHRSPTERAGV